MTAEEFALAVGILIGVVLGFTAGLIYGLQQATDVANRSAAWIDKQRRGL